MYRGSSGSRQEKRLVWMVLNSSDLCLGHIEETAALLGRNRAYALDHGTPPHALFSKGRTNFPQLTRFAWLILPEAFCTTLFYLTALLYLNSIYPSWVCMLVVSCWRDSPPIAGLNPRILLFLVLVSRPATLVPLAARSPITASRPELSSVRSLPSL